MTKVPCSYAGCGDRRAHFERPDEPRGVQWVDVGDDHEGGAYCSLTCAILDGKMCVHYSEHGGLCDECAGRVIDE